MSELTPELRAEIRQLRSEFRSEISSVKAELCGEMQSYRLQLDRSETSAFVAKTKADLIKWTIGIVFVQGGFVVGVVHFLH